MFSTRTTTFLFVTLLIFSFFSTPNLGYSEQLSQCALCHTDSSRMDELTEEAIIYGDDKDVTSSQQKGKGYWVQQAPFDLYEKMLVNPDFLTSTHGQIPCHLCHQGNPNSKDPSIAHRGMLADPSRNSQTTCVQCHDKIVATTQTSLHMDPAPLYKTLAARCSKEQLTGLKEKVLERQCLTCHQGSCGSCHVSRPDVTGGGLRNGHFFSKEPDFVYTCLPCHTHPTGNDFIGKKGEGDSHYRKYNMTCTACHSGEEMHATAKNSAGRYHFKKRPQCVDCHNNTQDDPIPEHVLHKDVSCAVCHAAPYQNCNSCHITTDTEGIAYSTSSKPLKKLLIGKNPDKDGPRYVLMREIGVERNTFDESIGNMQNFSALPTFKRASPHTIQRRTWQSADCNHCHGNKELFLTQDSISFDSLVANRHVLLKDTDVPGPVQAKRSFMLSPTKPDSAMRVSAEWLKKHRRDKDIVILDTRSKPDYEKGHIPGAFHLCFCVLRTSADSTPPYMMQKAEKLAELFGGSRLGLTPNKRVVIYGDGHSGRGITFLALKMIGHQKISFLDGNISSWNEKGYKLAKGRAPVTKTRTYPLKPVDNQIVTNHDIIELMGAGDAILIDTRNAAQHNAHMARSDIAKTGGAIPESISFSLQTLMDSGGKLYPTKRLAWLLSNAGISATTEKTIITTCNTNMLATEFYMILAYLGYDNVKVHDGSWAEWAGEFE